MPTIRTYAKEKPKTVLENNRDSELRAIEQSNKKVAFIEQLIKLFDGIDLSDVSYCSISCWERSKELSLYLSEVASVSTKLPAAMAKRFGVHDGSRAFFNAKKNHDGSAITLEAEHAGIKMSVQGWVGHCQLVITETELTEAEYQNEVANISRIRRKTEIHCDAQVPQLNDGKLLG